MIKLPDETEMKWRDLALQFDGHRMQAISLLKMIINDAPDDQYLSVRNFLKSGPLPGEVVLRNRIAEIAEVQRLNATSRMALGERESTKNLKWLFDLSKTCRALGVPVRLSDSQIERIAEEFLELEQRLNATAQPVSDGWVKCSERMPEEMSDVFVTDGKDVKDMWWNGKKWDSWADRYSLDSDSITHWMPKAAAPGGQDDQT